MDESGGKEKKTDSGILVAASVKNDGPKTVRLSRTRETY
jgi:hypothetical protein